MGREMREDGVEAFRYPSARDVRGGKNVALFTPAAFAVKRPEPPETWVCVATRAGVEFRKRDVFESRVFEFPREDFLVGGELPAPAP